MWVKWQRSTARFQCGLAARMASNTLVEEQQLREFWLAGLLLVDSRRTYTCGQWRWRLLTVCSPMAAHAVRGLRCIVLAAAPLLGEHILLERVEDVSS